MNVPTMPRNAGPDYFQEYMGNAAPAILPVVSHKRVYDAINSVQSALAKTGIAKDRTNGQGAGYKFRGIDDVYNALSPLLAEHRLCILPRMLKRECDERRSAADKALFYVTVEAEFDFVSAEDGSMHTVRTFGEAMDSGDKATNKAMSAAYKYAAFQAFAIPTEGDNDADAATHVVTPNDPLAIFSPGRAKVMRTATERAIELFNKGDQMAAYEEVADVVDKFAVDPQGKFDHIRRNQTLTAFWELLKASPAIKTYITNQMRAEAQKATA